MTIFKDDPIKKLNKLVRALKSAEALNWYTRNQADIETLVQFLKKEIPAIEGQTINEAQKHPEVVKDPLFVAIMSIFSKIESVVKQVENAVKKKAQYNPEAFSKQLHDIEADLEIILYESVMLKEKGLPAIERQEIIGGEELKKVGIGYDCRFTIDNNRAVFSTSSSMDHNKMKKEYFPGKNPVAGMIIASKRQIEVFESRHTEGDVIAMMDKLRGSVLAKDLHGFFILKAGKNIGRFISKHQTAGETIKRIVTKAPMSQRDALILELTQATDPEEKKKILGQIKKVHEGD
jgi:hypothetical protein